MADDLKPAYLFSGGDGAKLDRALSRLRDRAEREGGEGALETFSSASTGGPDVDAVASAIPAISLMATERYLLVDGVERWKSPQVKVIEQAMSALPPETVVVLIARGKAPKGLAEIVKGAGGESINFGAPKRRELPAWVVAAARERGLALNPRAAKLLVDRVGESTVRLSGELDKLALWAADSAEAGTGEAVKVGVEEVEAMTIDSSERAGWTLGDAIVARDIGAAIAAADGLMAQGEAVTPLVYGMASRLRNAHAAAAALEGGASPTRVEADLPMAPYPAKLLVRAVRGGVGSSELSRAIAAVAELEWWSRGGSNYDDETALTLAVREAAGGS